MDNDLMARRLRPPSQPTSQNGQSAQPPSPWDVPPTDDPPFAPPDPAARADVPWDRPAPEAWPPSEDAGATDYSLTWSAQAGAPAPHDPQSEWPAPDAAGDAAPWDRPANDQTLDPDDAMAPVVGDVHAPGGVWHEWSGDTSPNGYANGNGAGHYAASTPEPMTVAAHSDQPRGGDEPRPDFWADAPSGGNGPSLPEWPAEDDLTPPSSNRGPVMPEDSWPITPQETAPKAPPPAPEPQAETPAAPPAPPQPVASPPSVTPVVTSAQIVPSPAGSPQNMVLRIELAIVDETSRANPADAAKRVGPDADVRAPEYNPRTHGGRAPMPEPEYEWGAPPPPPDQRRQRQSQQPAPPSRYVAAPVGAWQPAPTQPTRMDWDLPQIGGPQVTGPEPDQPAPWSTPSQPQGRQSHMPPPVAPPPTWAMTEPTPPYEPEPAQYMPPPAPHYQQPAAPQYQQPVWPPSRSPDPLYDVPAAPSQQPAAYPPAAPPFAYPPAQSQYPAQPVQSVPSVHSAPAAGSRARTGQANAAADQADLWFLSNQPAAVTTPDDGAQAVTKLSSILTAILTIGFALLVIVLVLVFVQLMTSLLK
jgi:hypothetical protein